MRPKIPPIQTPPLRVEVIWYDAAVDDHQDSPVGTGGGLRESLGTIGYLVNKDRRVLVISSDYDYEDFSARTRHTIPLSQVKSITIFPRAGTP